MKINQLPKLQRREFLRRSAQLGLAGVAAPWALNLAALGEAAAASCSSAGDDYKALVCVFLYGANDNGRTLVPINLDTSKINNYYKYVKLRGGNVTAANIIQSQGLVQARNTLLATALTPRLEAPMIGPGAAGTQLAMAAELAPLKKFFDRKNASSNPYGDQLGWLLNVGTLEGPISKAQYLRNENVPLSLFSHNDQQSLWQSGGIEGSTKGYGGAIGDLFLNAGCNTNSTFTCINASGNAVFMTGGNAVQYRVSSSNSGAIPVNGVKENTLFGSRECSEALKNLITAPAGTHWFETELTRVTKRSVETQSMVSNALATTDSPTTFPTVFPDTKLSDQLKMVARMIAGRGTLGAKRQVFFVSLGGFDHHDFLLDRHPVLMADLANSLEAFQLAMNSMGVADKVTTFTASDFGRTLTSNGDGSDHGWGSYHMIMGGAVKGGRFWGEMPVLANGGENDIGQGRLLPTTSVAQTTATLAKWLGVSDSELPLVVPNIGNFSQRDLGFFT